MGILAQRLQLLVEQIAGLLLLLLQLMVEQALLMLLVLLLLKVGRASLHGCGRSGSGRLTECESARRETRSEERLALSLALSLL